jgi:Bromodomain
LSPTAQQELKEAYMMKIRKPMDLTTVECNLLEGNRYSSADDFVQDVSLVFSNAITFNKDGRDVGDPLSCAYYDASIHLLRYSRWLSLELLANETADIEAVDEEDGEGEDKLPPLSWKLTTGNRNKAREEMESLVMNEPIEKSIEGDRFTWMEAECEKLLKALRHQSDLRQMTFFIAANYPADYAAFISKPMDWQKVQTNLKNREYDTFGEACADLRLIFSNALKYNARLKGTDTVSGRAYDAAKYMSAKLEAAIIKMMLSVSDRLERERIDHANAEREIEAAEQAEEARIRATWKKETTSDGAAAPAKADGSVKIKGPVLRMQMKRRESTDFEIPFFDEEDDGQHERSYFDAVKQQKALFERQRQDLAKMRQASMTTGAAVFARFLQRQKAKTWLSAMQKLSTKTDPKYDKQSATMPNAEGNSTGVGASVLTELEKEGRVPVKLTLASLGQKNKKRKRLPAITFDYDSDD